MNENNNQNQYFRNINLTLVLTILAIIADIALIVNVIHHW
jgi:hypothetical protein